MTYFKKETKEAFDQLREETEDFEFDDRDVFMSALHDFDRDKTTQLELWDIVCTIKIKAVREAKTEVFNDLARKSVEIGEDKYKIILRLWKEHLGDETMLLKKETKEAFDQVRTDFVRQDLVLFVKSVKRKSSSGLDQHLCDHLLQILQVKKEFKNEMTPVQKGICYIKEHVPFSSGYYEGDMEDVVIKALKLAVREARSEVNK